VHTIPSSARLLALLALVALLLAGAAAPAQSHAQGLAASPTLSLGTYLGGSGADEARGVAVDRSGNIYVTGNTYSTNFIGARGEQAGGSDIFVAKLDPSGGRVIYSTVIGGRGQESGLAIAVNAAGEAVVTATTDSDTFPTTPDAAFPTPPNRTNGLLLRLSPAGALVYGSYLGFSMYQSEQRGNLALDPAGNIYVTGKGSGELSQDLVAAKYGPDGKTQFYAMLLGGARSEDAGVAIAADANGNAYIVGTTKGWGRETDFPLTGDAFQGTCGRFAGQAGANCTDDAFLMVIDAAGENYLYSTLLGGGASDAGTAVAVGAGGAVAVAGGTYSPDFPTLNAFQRPCPSGLSSVTSGCNSQEAFVARIVPGEGASFSTVLGARDRESMESVVGVGIDGTGATHVVGFTHGAEFPVRAAVQSALGAGFCDIGADERRCYDAFVASFSPAGELGFSSYLGGAGDDYSFGAAVDRAGSIYLVGSTANSFPTTPGAVQPTRALREDAFVARLAPGATGGSPTAGRYQLNLPLLMK